MSSSRPLSFRPPEPEVEKALATLSLLHARETDPDARLALRRGWYLLASHAMDLPPTCRKADCRRHRNCRFDFDAPLRAKGDPDTRFNMARRGLPLCLASHFAAFGEWRRALAASSGRHQNGDETAH